MKSARSLALVACLAAPALRVSAQEQTTTAGSFDVRDPASHDNEGPLARAVSRAAAGLASVAVPASGSGDVIPQGNNPAHSNWSRVRDIEPGTEITVMVKGALPGQRYFIAADDASLTVLTMTDTLSPDVKSALAGAAEDHPDYFAVAQQGRTFVLHKRMRLTLTREGLLLGDQRIADREQIVTQIARDDVAEITAMRHHVIKEMLIGTAVGAGAGVVVGLLSKDECAGMFCSAEFTVGLPIALFAGMGTGVGAAFGATHKTLDVIYRAPPPPS